MKVTVDGIEIELTNEQVKEIEEKKRAGENPFSRVPYKEDYYYITSKYSVCKNRDINDEDDVVYHSNANYCSNKELIQQRAYWLQLEQLLWRDSCIKNKRESTNGDDTVTYIAFNTVQKEWNLISIHKSFSVPFPCYKSFMDASDAIENIVKPFCEKHPDFIV